MASANCIVAFWRALQIVGNKISFLETEWKGLFTEAGQSDWINLNLMYFFQIKCNFPVKLGSFTLIR